MKYANDRPLHVILNSLFNTYSENVSDVKKITNALIQNEVIADQTEIVNDHIAFRTLGVKHLGIDSFEKIFLQHGYTKRDAYYFEQKKLDANWYSPPSSVYPRIFISQLRVQDLSDNAQAIIKKYTKNIDHDPVDKLDLMNGSRVGSFLHSPLWDTPTKEEYESLLAESEYAAWVIYNRYYLNHYTISVHALPKGYNSLEEFNAFLEGIGITLNTAGGKIKQSKDGLLLQSSSVSALKKVRFSCGNSSEIAGSYVEFAERKVLPEFVDVPADKIQPRHRRDGFETGNADKIFESTYSEQTLRK